ncbi:MAG: hypothetical protein GYA47_04185 [Desulfovibrio sp.]|nr:hypothetical protein [Desulfovibrio sp.]
MDIQTEFDPESRIGTLTLRGACGTEDAAGLARALRELTDAAGGQPWTAALDMSGIAAVGMAFFEVVFAASLVLARQGTSLVRRGEQSECVRQAAKLTGFCAAPGLSGLFA